MFREVILKKSLKSFGNKAIEVLIFSIPPIVGFTIASMAPHTTFNGLPVPILIIIGSVCLGLLAAKMSGVAYRLSIETADDMTAAEPDSLLDFNDRGCSYLERHEYRKAIIEFNKAIILNAGCRSAYKNRAIAFKQLGKPELAAIDDRTLTELESKCVQR